MGLLLIIKCRESLRKGFKSTIRTLLDFFFVVFTFRRSNLFAKLGRINYYLSAGDKKCDSIIPRVIG